MKEDAQTYLDGAGELAVDGVVDQEVPRRACQSAGACGHGRAAGKKNRAGLLIEEKRVPEQTSSCCPRQIKHHEDGPRCTPRSMYKARSYNVNVRDGPLVGRARGR